MTKKAKKKFHTHPKVKKGFKVHAHVHVKKGFHVHKKHAAVTVKKVQKTQQAKTVVGLGQAKKKKAGPYSKRVTPWEEVQNPFAG
jgi:predicted TIM-barrel enzyme